MPSKQAFNILRESSPTISVGILSADLMNLSSQLALLEGAGIRAIHFDVMDGRFAPLITVGPPFIKAIRTSLLKDVHLLIDDPGEKVFDFVRAGADMITLHLESSTNIRPILHELGKAENKNDPERGIIRGVAISPETSVEELRPLLADLELILILTVDLKAMEKGFLDSTGERVAQVRELITSANKEILLSIDGGVNLKNLPQVAKLRPDIVVSGSAIFSGGNPRENINFMLEILESAANQKIP